MSTSQAVPHDPGVLRPLIYSTVIKDFLINWLAGLAATGGLEAPHHCNINSMQYGARSIRIIGTRESWEEAAHHEFNQKM